MPVRLDQQIQSNGLSDNEADQRRGEFGPNEVEERRPSLWRNVLKKFWSPVSWMLEAVIILQLALGRTTGAMVIAFLLVFNAAVALVQERRAGDALALLKSRLQIQARVRRNGNWVTRSAADLVPGDLIHLRVGDVVPADIVVGEGTASVDQSALTGESVSEITASGSQLFAGSLVRQGEVTGLVSATGSNSYYGRTFELVQSAAAPGHMQTTIFKIVKRLMVFDAAMVTIVVAYALFHGLPLTDTVLFALMMLIASVPAALPTTYTLATATASAALAHHGVLVTRLPAIEEAAGMDILVTDKTGTLTQNRLSYDGATPLAQGIDRDTVLRAAAEASDPATLDPLDSAILAAAKAAGHSFDLSSRQSFTPFDPLTRFSSAVFRDDEGERIAMKGAGSALALNLAITEAQQHRLARAERALSANGARVLAVAAGPVEGPALIGAIALADPPRPDATMVVEAVGHLGIRIVMATGDSEETARAIGTRLGLGNRVCVGGGDSLGDVDQCDLFARVLPADKFDIVKAWQACGHIVGMTGDGVNDAPALKQAELGIAVSSATDAAKAAAGIVLVEPGLNGVTLVVKTGREVHRRMLTYTLNKILKTLVTVSLLTAGLFLTGGFVISSTLIVLLLFTNDFMTMAIAGDNASARQGPQRWDIDELTRLSLAYAVPSSLAAIATFWWIHATAMLDQAGQETTSFLILVLFGQAFLYALRTDGPIWSPAPGLALLLASLADIMIVCGLAIAGLLMAPVPWLVLVQVGAAAILLALGLSILKFTLHQRLS